MVILNETTGRFEGPRKIAIKDAVRLYQPCINFLNVGTIIEGPSLPWIPRVSQDQIIVGISSPVDLKDLRIGHAVQLE
jgi:hypothetical protein